MQFTINGMTIPLAVPYLKAEAALELITAEDGIQLNVLIVMGWPARPSTSI